MESTHKEFVKNLRVRHELGKTKSTPQERIKWWKNFRILIQREEEKELAEAKTPRVRSRYMRRLVEKYAKNLEENGQRVSSEALWQCFVDDAGGQYEGGFTIQYWGTGIKIAISEMTEEPIPMASLECFDIEEEII